jgi:hypothetical protein
MSGRDWLNHRQNITSHHPAVHGGRDYGLRGTGSIIHPEQRPFYVEGRMFLHNVTSYMGTGAVDPWLFWVTSDIWIHKFRTFTGAVVDTVGAPQIGKGYQCTQCNMFINAPLDFYAYNYFNGYFDFIGNNPPPTVIEDAYVHCGICDYLLWYPEFREHNRPQGMAARMVETYWVNALEVRGLMGRDDTFTPYPWYTFEACASILHNRLDGEYAIHFYDVRGYRVAISYFDVDFHASLRMEGEGNRSVARPTVPVDMVVRFPEHTASISIYKGELEIYNVVLTQNAPTVRFTGLRDYQQLGNSVNLTWEASGERDLFFEIWYSPAEDEWYNIATDITGRSFVADLSELPGSTMGYFYIYATDGVRSSEIDSPWVSVPYKAPTILTDLSGVPQFKITEEFFLDVDIYDIQDGWLWCLEEVTWYLDGKEFMYGSCLWVWPYEIGVGSHTFTVVATNSAGLSVQGSLEVYVINDESDLPNDWSRDDVVFALSNGFASDLRRLDAPITRGHFAGFMTTLFIMMQEGELWVPDYQEGVILDGGQGSYDAFLMIYLGVMDAPGGRFNPSGTLTQREAALIMYRVSEMADPDWFGRNANDRYILSWLYDIDVLEHSGPNTFNDTAVLTNRLALVRLARLYDAVFVWD